jgi:hypothetical protein
LVSDRANFLDAAVTASRAAFSVVA